MQTTTLFRRRSSSVDVLCSAKGTLLRPQVDCGVLFEAESRGSPQRHQPRVCEAQFVSSSAARPRVDRDLRSLRTIGCVSFLVGATTVQACLYNRCIDNSLARHALRGSCGAHPSSPDVPLDTSVLQRTSSVLDARKNGGYGQVADPSHHHVRPVLSLTELPLFVDGGG